MTVRLPVWGAIACAPFLLGIGSAHAEPLGCPTGATVDGSGCSLRLTLVTVNSTDGTMTVTPVGSSTPITIVGEPDSYLRSAGFGSDPPALVQQWDATIDRVGNTNPADPDWYGEGKAKAFLPRQLNELAPRLPAGTIVARFVPDASDSHLLQLVSIQPVAQ